MVVHCVDEKGAEIQNDAESRPKINVPKDLKGGKSLSFDLNRYDQEKFIKNGHPLKKILVTFPKKCKCTISKFSWRFRNVNDLAPLSDQYLDDVYRFLLGSPTYLMRAGQQHHMTSNFITTNILSTASAPTAYTTGMSTNPWNTRFTSVESSRMNTSGNNAASTHYTTPGQQYATSHGMTSRQTPDGKTYTTPLYYLENVGGVRLKRTRISWNLEVILPSTVRTSPPLA